jgi:hypothetical protein
MDQRYILWCHQCGVLGVYTHQELDAPAMKHLLETFAQNHVISTVRMPHPEDDEEARP